jgi:DNA invertase Pin-like site-specific DNA recombinase
MSGKRVAQSESKSQTQQLTSPKISTRHLAKLAMIYVRQSSTRQVRENVESTQLQYKLVDRAQTYGWQADRTEIIDEDLGVSGQSVVGRTGFQRLLAEISLGHVGIVFGIEMSRLARNCRDWHQLLELCAVFDTLIGDADGIYNPREYNDRLLLGLKGTMSEAELHILRGRLEAGRKNKAQRGEYFAQAPIGYVRTKDGMAMDPDDQARHVVELIFQKFDELGSVNAVLRLLRSEGLMVGVRPSQGSTSGPLEWRALTRSTITRILHHPIYAGAYIYGRALTDPSRRVEGKANSGRRLASQDEWQVLLPDRLPAYITWEQWERNQRRMKENSTSFSAGPPRGASLIAGRITCGRCGARMPVSYKVSRKPYFCCSQARMNLGEPLCQAFDGGAVESLVEELILIALAPASVDLSLQAAESIDRERERREAQYARAVERAIYESELARRRYEEVDPSNRLVASELERRWESLLQVQRKAEEALNRFRQEMPTHLAPAQRQAVLELADNFPKLWRSESTTAIDRQTIVRALVTDIVVTVINNTERLSVTVHWAGGLQTQHESRRHVQSFDRLEGSHELAKRAGQLYNEGYPLSEIAKQLNAEGYRPAKQDKFTKTSIGAFCNMLRRKGLIGTAPKVPRHFWRAGAICKRVGIAKPTLSGWRRRKWIQYRQIGIRYIYWADGDELKRLKALAKYPASGSTPTPTRLTTPIKKMPSDPAEMREKQ